MKSYDERIKMQYAFEKRRDARQLARLARATQKPSVARMSVIPDGDSTGTSNTLVNNPMAGVKSEFDKLCQETSVWVPRTN
jgi:hypothetical protein